MPWWMEHQRHAVIIVSVCWSACDFAIQISENHNAKYDAVDY